MKCCGTRVVWPCVWCSVVTNSVAEVYRGCVSFLARAVDWNRCRYHHTRQSAAVNLTINVTRNCSTFSWTEPCKSSYAGIECKEIKSRVNSDDLRCSAALFTIFIPVWFIFWLAPRVIILTIEEFKLLRAKQWVIIFAPRFNYSPSSPLNFS